MGEHRSGSLFINLILKFEGGERIAEAAHIFQDLSEKYGVTAPLLNGLAVCALHEGQYAKAEKLLLQALEKVDVISISFHSAACWRSRHIGQSYCLLSQSVQVSRNHCPTNQVRF